MSVVMEEILPSDDANITVADSTLQRDEEVNLQPSAMESRSVSLPERRPFDHSNRKVVIFNASKQMRPKEVEVFMSGLKSSLQDIIIEKYKKPHSVGCIHLTLQSESMVDGFLYFFNQGQFKNKKGGLLVAKRVDEERKEGGKSSKHPRNHGDEEDAHKKLKVIDANEFIKTDDQVRDAIAPLWRLDYDQQLDQKAKVMVNKCLVKIIAETKAKVTQLSKERGGGGRGKMYDWLLGKKIPMESIIGAPVHDKYRNKCEFTFGYYHYYKDDNDRLQKIVTKVPSLGFMASGWSGGVSWPHCLPHVSDEMCGIVDIVHGFLQDSPMPPYDPREHCGIWRTMTVRVSQRTKQCMVIIQHSPPSGIWSKGVEKSENGLHVFDSEKQRLITLLTRQELPIPQRPTGSLPLKSGDNAVEPSSGIKVTSIFFQEYEGASHPTPDHPVQHAYGLEYIEERLLQSIFQISPGAFFQVTTEGAEVLYKLIVDKVKEVTTQPNDTLLYDVCCGTGTIGLTCLKEGAVGSVVGVDISDAAIKDARVNAEKNGLDNTGCASFIAARAEQIMIQEVQKSMGKPVIAVVDPARDGLHPEVVRAIRNSSVQRLIYVSCNPTGSLIKDCSMLCSPPTTKYRGLPFKPTSAQPVDMFPHTDHCELVLVLDRMTPIECGYSH